MIALLWKELRENFKWAVVAAVFLGIAEVFAIYPDNGWPGSYNWFDGVTLAKHSFLAVTTFGSVVIGFLLGLVQILPELKQDRWAALLHRPTQRGRIYGGKAIAGVLLYAFATGLPFAVSIWWAATPGHLPAPFVPGLVWPGLVENCLGLAFYFAGLLVGLHRGGWPGSRILPLFAAFYILSVAHGTPSLGVALAAIGLMALGLGMAGWGAIHHLSSWNSRPWIGRIAFLAVAFYGLLGLGNILQGLVKTGGHSVSQSNVYQLSDDGRPLRIIYTKGGLTSVLDPNGLPVTQREYQPDQIRSHIHVLAGCTAYLGDSHGWLPPSPGKDYRLSTTYVSAEAPYSYPRFEQWFYLIGQRYMVGMVLNKKLSFALLDNNGFEPVSATPVPFNPGVNLNALAQDSLCIWSKDSVRIANLSRRTIVKLSLPAPGPIYGEANTYYVGDTETRNAVAVALIATIAVYDGQDGKLVATLPYHHDIDRWGSLAVGVNRTKDRFYLLYQPSLWLDGGTQRTMPWYFDEMDTQGQVLHSYTLPPLPDPIYVTHWVDALARYLQSPVLFWGNWLHPRQDTASRIRDANSPARKSTAMWILSFSAIFAGTTLWWARRLGFSGKSAVAWSALTMALNLPGLLLFRLVSDWPRRVPCPHCHRLRPIDGNQCPSCAAGWPGYPPNGTEIFDHPDASSVASTAV